MCKACLMQATPRRRCSGLVRGPLLAPGPHESCAPPLLPTPPPQAALGPVHLDHPALALALAPHLSLREAVAGAARQRLRLDAQLKADPALRPGGKYDGRPADFALERLLFYKCSK